VLAIALVLVLFFMQAAAVAAVDLEVVAAPVDQVVMVLVHQALQDLAHPVVLVVQA
jgi:hypothetical protein